MNPEDFPRAVRSTMERYGMDLARPLAMVSGGPDSVALLRVLVALGAEPVVLHVDHGLREESGEDADFVRELCRDLGVGCEVRRIVLGGSNLQESAREERYRLAGELMRANGLLTIATGHTSDDVAETVLLNLARGAGPRGLSGIPPVRGPFVRPLIEHRKAEVLQYLDCLSQPYRTDPTNQEPKYARNRVRLEVMPVLEELHPGAAANVARGAALLREDLEALDALAAQVVVPRGEETVVPLPKLKALPHALQRHAVRRAYALTLPHAPPLGSVHVEALLTLTERSEGTRMMDLPGAVISAVRGAEEIAFYEKKPEPSGEELLRAGESRFGGWSVEVSEVFRFDPDDAARPAVVYLDASGGPYRVRMAREGDTMRPLGLGGRRKVMRAMMDRKVPRDLRRRTPVVVGPSGEIAWVFGGELGEEFRVEAGTERMLRLEAGRIHEDE